MNGFKVSIQKQQGEPELRITYTLALPSLLTNPQKMKLVRNYLNDVKSTQLPASIVEELQAMRQLFKETVGADIVTATAALTVQKNEQLKEANLQETPEFVEKITQLYDDPLIMTSTDLIYEALKNTYDAVMIRNYLASMPPQAIKEKEPLVYAAMQKNHLREITPVDTLEFRSSYKLTPEGSTIFITDNGPGKDIVEAFKLQHSSDARVRMDKRDLESKFKLDSIYNLSTGHFNTLGLRTGGVGKGRKVEEQILKSIHATSEFSHSPLGIALGFYRSSNPSLEDSPSTTPRKLNFEEGGLIKILSESDSNGEENEVTYHLVLTSVMKQNLSPEKHASPEKKYSTPEKKQSSPQKPVSAKPKWRPSALSMDINKENTQLDENPLTPTSFVTPKNKK